MLMFLSLVFAVAAAAPTVDDCPATIPHDRSLRVFGDFCYSFLVSERRDFNAAEQECASNSGHLVSIRDAATQKFLYDTLVNDFHYKRGVVWIGLTDQQREGQFVWTDGTPAHYTNWASGQPGGLLGTLEDCAAMDVGKGGVWHDYQCKGFLFLHQSHIFVCEYPLASSGSGGSTAPPAASTAGNMDTTVMDTTAS